MHLLESLVDEVLDREPVSFVRKETRVHRLSSKNLKISAAVNTFHQKKEEKSRFPAMFWLKNQVNEQQKLKVQLHITCVVIFCLKIVKNSIKVT